MRRAYRDLAITYKLKFEVSGLGAFLSCLELLDSDETNKTAWMYILECSDGTYYVGSTKNLEYRVSEHQSGKGAKYTSRRLPIKLVYSEEYERIVEAHTREKQVQNWSRAKRQALINGNPESLPKLAKKDFTNKRK